MPHVVSMSNHLRPPFKDSVYSCLFGPVQFVPGRSGLSRRCVCFFFATFVSAESQQLSLQSYQKS